jgi:predicted O-methyltransferase YrrM
MKDHFTFNGKDIVESFRQALARGQEFIQENPESTFQILFDSTQEQVVLDYQVVSQLRHFTSLFGPGDVPGLCSEGDIQAIAELAKRLPAAGTFVELGPLFGKSTVEWARNLRNLNKDYKIIAIDSYNTPLDIIKALLDEAEFDIPPGNNQLEIFKHYTRDYDNIRPLEMLWTLDYNFDMKVAGVFEDMTSTSKAEPGLLDYWWDRIQPGGMLCGKNYGNPIVVKYAVDQLALKHDCEVELFDNSTVWCIIKK